MKLTRIYYPGELVEKQNVVLTALASHHILKVLRLTIGTNLIVFNGRGSEYQAELIAADKKLAELMLLSKSKKDVVRESNLKITLAQGISRGERMDYVIQKAVELGVSVINPIYTEHCGVRLNPDRLQKRLKHWQGVIISACEQSGRLRVPTLNSAQSLDDFISEPDAGLKLVCTPDAEPVELTEKPKQVTLLIGPEGGLTDDEVSRAVKVGFCPYALGPRVLRTETATVVALTMAQLRWGDM